MLAGVFDDDNFLLTLRLCHLRRGWYCNFQYSQNSVDSGWHDGSEVVELRFSLCTNRAN